MSLDLLAAKQSYRLRLTSTVLVTTGAMALAAVADGYTRADGSFLADGWKPGMEVTPSGFTANPVAVVTDVTALKLTTATTRAVESSASGRTLTAKLPRMRAFDGQDMPTLTPNVPAMREAFIHPGSTLRTQSGESHDVVYLVTLFAPKSLGTDWLDVAMTVLLRRFRSGLVLDTGGQAARVRANPGPYAGQLLPADTPGFVYRLLTVPGRVDTRAAVLT